VQEAIWNGKPLLITAMLYDGPYNAWVASEFGAALSLGTTASVEVLTGALRMIADPSPLAAGARALQATIRELDGQARVRELVDQLCAAKP
jgi:UDP:flavonoid glycosyltransferase YjiC (YdhE family)